MKKMSARLLVGAAVVISLAGCGSQTAHVSEHDWVNPIGTDQCSIAAGDLLSSSVSLFGRSIVQLESGGGGGARCEEGAIFFYDKDFDTMNATYETKSDDLYQHQELLKRLMADPVAQPRIQKVGGHQWVTPEPQTLDEDVCSINTGDTLREIAVHEDQVLVRLAEGGGGGARCSLGTILFVPEAQFVAMNDQYEAVTQAIDENRKLVDELVAQRPTNPRLYSGEFSGWVDEEPYGLDGATCLIDEMNVLAEIGVADDGRRLMEVVTGENPIPEAVDYTACNTGVLFFSGN